MSQVAHASNTTMTPAGIQGAAMLTRRRALAGALNGTTFLLLAAALAIVLGAGGWTLIDALILLCFLIAAPWSVLGFWNAMIGLWLLHGPGPRNALDQVAPYAGAGDRLSALAARTAVLMTLRNEDPGRAFLRLAAVKASLDATGQGAHFSYFALSDTSEAVVAVQEDALFAQWQQSAGTDGARVHYRRRDDNAGYKAGNVRDFCARWGGDFDFMLPLDADSLMAGATILRMVRIMEAYPKLGLLQSLVVGTPAQSAFARIFQFGMRHGMRAYTMGSAWWAGDCGPFWGHNALVRIAPFAAHCDLPVLPGGGPLGGQILSHDQLEAVLLRRAGFEVRVLPEETGSYEDNPPTILEFTRRDLRWCQGNMQYWRLLGMPGLKFMSRFQLLWAIMMFVGIPAWTLIIALVALKGVFPKGAAEFPAGLALGVYGAFLLMYLAPKLAGFLDIALSQGELARYGGGWRFAAGCVTELLFSFLLGAVTTFRTALFMLGLLFGRTVGWSGQSRDAHALSWETALKGLWPQTLFGVIVLALYWHISPALALWSLPLTAGFVLAVPYAVLTSSPWLGALLARAKLCGIPEEFSMPPEIRAIGAGKAGVT